MAYGLIKIGTINIRKKDNCYDLITDVNDNGVTKELFFTVDIKYAEYLATERSDAFVTVLLYYAMFNGYDIQWEIPCTEQLIYQLTAYYIPICAKEISFMHPISLMGKTTSEALQCEGGVGTGFSGGVDSCYTIKKHLETYYIENRLTHLLFTDCFTVDFSEKYQKDFLDKYLHNLPGQAEELGLEFIFVRCNIDILFSIGRYQDPVCGEIIDGGLFTLKYCSMAMALQKLFQIYYFSGGVSPTDFTFLSYDCAYYDMFTLPLLSTKGLQFYSAGMEVNRMEKVEAISDWKFAQKHLQVCIWDNDGNCGHCGKCIRTMSELYVLDKLEYFKERFPVEDYKRHLNKRFGKVLMEAHKGHIFEKDILFQMEESGKKIPFLAYVLCPFYLLIEWTRLKLKKVRWARKLYRKFHLDKMLYGRSTEEYSQSVDKEVLRK
ncbi:MAG: hypothetical protein HFH89_10005 [Lachnospiraceae bacterium]|nr:hypothetical protein [uncultured Acetatifactor sp.]MCI8287969.1 hypothetical protein [Lachnospiraceae bacterium]